ncbi:probable 2-oxoglutarate-dependent dioxygenase AOP1 [Argentina anserina]|uniref:probable 2-oxoglutarate-dependent dioxygenase AOP1 n=1 Tax=Argentina anserina TaxID=57926 RepID=UPI00217640CE|nr:probable 2-oxoglutarate-dependent dioxygenase AOP1 [Potentilla anserina]
MGSDSHYQIPTIDLSTSSAKLARGTEKWFSLCKRVREACENYGFFELVYDKIPLELSAESFSVTREFFSLPLETKKQDVNPKSFHGYYGQHPVAPLYESFAIEDASNYESLTSFTEKMWPDGHDQFLNTVIGMVNKLDELHEMIEMMILDSYGLGENQDSIMACETKLRVSRYGLPPSGEYVNGLNAHTDKQLTAILCDDQVSGLEFETKDKSQWIKLSLPPSSFVFIVGDSLMAWSNGRMHSAKHRVMMCGEKERYSLGVFAIPVEGTIIKAPKELVDEEHPQLFKDFEYMDFTKYSTSEEAMAAAESAMHIWSFAGISS